MPSPSLVGARLPPTTAAAKERRKSTEDKDNTTQKERKEKYRYAARVHMYVSGVRVGCVCAFRPVESIRSSVQSIDPPASNRVARHGVKLGTGGATEARWCPTPTTSAQHRHHEGPCALDEFVKAPTELQNGQIPAHNSIFFQEISQKNRNGGSDSGAFGRVIHVRVEPRVGFWGVLFTSSRSEKNLCLYSVNKEANVFFPSFSLSLLSLLYFAFVAPL
jgi:hypothetical protein